MPPCRSKLLVMTWLCEAARNLRSVQFAAICPGAIASNIARNTPYLAGLVTFLMKIFFPSPYKAAAPVVWMALADNDELSVDKADSIVSRMGATSIHRQPIYYQHLWQRVRAIPAAFCLFHLMCCRADKSLAPCNGYGKGAARVCRHECRC
jgi:hypothetical protein